VIFVCRDLSLRHKIGLFERNATIALASSGLEGQFSKSVV
jgi:hypothetical protein